METVTVKRKDLYNQVWSTPISRLAPNYDLSDVGFKKICKKLNVPTPPRGYWAKIKHSKKVRQSPLPKLSEGGFDTWTFHIYSKGKESKRNTYPTPKKTINFKLDVDIRVSKTLHSLYPVVKKTYDCLKKEKTDHLGRIRAWREGCLDVYIGPDSIQRAMKILNALLKGLSKLGYEIVLKKEKFSRSFILIEGEKVQFCLREKSYRKKHILTEKERQQKYDWGIPEWDYITTGELYLELSGFFLHLDRKKWSDGKKAHLEDLLNDFVMGAIKAARNLKEERKLREEWRKREEEERKRREEIQRLRKIELEKRERLEAYAESFTKSHYIYHFVSEIEKRLEELPLSPKEEQKAKKWINWAKEHADRLNPVNQVLNSLLKEDQDENYFKL